PPRQRLRALREELRDEGAEHLRDGAVGDAALVLVELARHEAAAPEGERVVHLLDEGRLSNTGVAAHEEEPGPAPPLERREEPLDFGGATIQLLREPERFWLIFTAELEGEHRARALELREAGVEITAEAGRGLITIVRVLGEQLEEDIADPLR